MSSMLRATFKAGSWFFLPCKASSDKSSEMWQSFPFNIFALFCSNRFGFGAV